MSYPDASVVYAIENTVNGNRYIGSTTNYKSRWHTHRSTLRRGKHHSFILQKAWDKYGEAAFTFKVLLFCKPQDRIFYETTLMPLQEYNVLRTPRESVVRGGWHHTPEMKAHISAMNSGKEISAAQRQQLSKFRTGRVESAEFRRKARERQLGVIPSSETRARLSAAIKAARSAETERLSSVAWEVYELCKRGMKVRAACTARGMSVSTFYNYVARLSLPLLGHSARRAV